ncbi:endopeptidase La [[Mycoplasma] testudinis]|uniref:endopeptidase La n=1 Tax=[Mycoplasma] testudinis TaxID=33924 RepID=UPI000487CF0E|nr:endopeptidase La [[Mycoplasma] testudinis]
MKKAHLLISREIIVFPNCVKEIDVGRKRSLEAIEGAFKTKNKHIIITAQISSEIEEPTNKDIYPIGTLCEIQKMEPQDAAESGIASTKLTVKGIQRVQLGKYNHLSATPVIEYETLKSTNVSQNENSKRIRDIFGFLDTSILSAINESKEETDNPNRTIGVFSGDADKLSDILANAIDGFTVAERQNLLATLDVTKRLDVIVDFLKNHAKKVADQKATPDDKNSDFQQIDRKITKKINDNLNKQQREFYLRERLKAIKEELGDISTKEDDVSELRDKVNNNPYPKYIKEKIISELNRYESTMNSQENSIIRTYVEWLLDLPWWQEGKDNEDIKKVSKTLDKNHYGLQKVKERIIEYLAVLMRTKKIKGPIMCLVGPPGVGKSSLAKSIAESLGKEFVKMSLGGVHDESEIRGHRKTYIGSMPGRIIKGMKKAKVVNPLFLLDEIDKMTSDNHGDPASALLEVLDPELNNKFNDNYIEEDYDLSKVMFVATANYAEGIPEALYDRMEIIELTSYTENEKLAIAKNYLVPRTLENASLSTKELSFSDEAISYIIKHFTREAGVRQLERTIQQIARKFLVRSQKGEIENQKIDIKAVKYYLKKEIFDYTTRDEDAIPGIVNGMAYTSSGGDLLPIEVTHSVGKGDIVITGNLKETMRESANVALGYVKSNAKEFGIDPEIFKTTDIHIHVPSGGIPKDGPSAGIALTTAIISALTGKKVDPTVAMTGEITLRGKVLVIGGVKEKTISAHRGGVRTIFMPEKDERYLDEVPKEIKDDLTIIFVKKYKDVYKRLFK